MKTYQRKRTLEEFKAICKKNGWTFDDSQLDSGSDHVSFTFKVGRTTGTALWSTVNGRFFGKIKSGVRFSSDDTFCEGTKWFQALLDATLTNDPAPATANSQS